MEKIKITQLEIDPNLKVREVNEYAVSRYAEAMRNGDEFPPVVVDQKNRLICGHTRYYAYKRAFKDPELMVKAERKTFKTEADALMFAASDNARHGLPLDTWDKKNITIKLLSMKRTPEEIAKLFGVSANRIEDWAGMTVVIVGKKGQRTQKPVKNGSKHMIGQEVTEEAYENHAQREMGIHGKYYSSRLFDLIKYDWIDTEDAETMGSLKQLHQILTEFLKKNK